MKGSMRVLYDGLIYTAQATGGVNRYFANLIERLPDHYRPAITTTHKPDLNWPDRRNLQVIRYRRFRPSRISNPLEKKFFNFVTGLRRHDVVHPTYYDSLSGAEWDACARPIVFTVYDMIHERFASTLDPTGEHCEVKRRAIMRADAVICISESTKADLLEYYPVDESRITVTHLAGSLDAAHTQGTEDLPTRPYFLYLGNRAPYKNFDGLLVALSKIVPTCSDLLLRVVGKPLDPTETRQIASLGLRDHVRECGYVTDAQLAALYRSSLAFVYPSLYEGFGIPPLEAMACGTVVVAADTSSIPEVVGDAGLLFDPQSPDEFVDALRLVLDDPARCAALIVRGRERANSFSWDRTAAKTVKVYEAVARG